MIENVKYVHTNLIARDWKVLSRFYQDVFGCVPVPPQRDFRGNKMDAGTGIKGVHITGEHLRLPGYGSTGPTLEIFSYQPEGSGSMPTLNRPGFGHIAFSVEDVTAARDAVIMAGGQPVGEVVEVQTATGARVEWCYMRDIEGNILELQAWKS